ncbi:MAG: restriction endonuclease subunit S [Candidatus Heimdallarchaeaceae archaeon]
MSENIPEGWRKVKLSDVVHTPISGSRPKGGVNNNSGTIPSIGAEFITSDGRLNFEGMKYISKEFFNSMKNGKLRKDDILICKDGALTGKVAYYDKEYFPEAAINEHVFILRTKDGTIPKFVFYVLQSGEGQNQLKKIMTGSAQPGINTKFINFFELLQPSESEQSKIAEILSTVDEAIEATNKIIKETEKIKKGLMQDLLVKGVNHKEFVDTAIGKIPKSWKIEKLGNLGEFLKGKGISKKDVRESGLPCIRYGEIYTDHHFKIKQFHSFIDSSSAKDSTKIEKGDLLFAGSGETVEEIGKCVAYLGYEEAYAGGDIIILRIKNQNSLYFSYILNSSIARKQINRLGQGYSVVHIYPKQLQNIKVPVPPQKEQNEIVTIIDRIDQRIDAEKRNKLHLQKLKKALMQKLLTGKIRVKVD